VQTSFDVDEARVGVEVGKMKGVRLDDDSHSMNTTALVLLFILIPHLNDPSITLNPLGGLARRKPVNPALLGSVAQPLLGELTHRTTHHQAKP